MERIYDDDIIKNLVLYFLTYKKINKKFRNREFNYAMKSKENYILYLHRIKGEVPTIKVPISKIKL